MPSQFIQLGDFDLTGRVYSEFKPSGGYIDVKQDGAASIFTGARKGDPKGTVQEFDVCFVDEDEASEFLAFCYANSPAASDFDEKVGADVKFYKRYEDWYYRVWGIVAKENAMNKEPLDYIQYLYHVVLYLYSPISYADSSITWAKTGITSLPETKSIDNSDGHLPSAFESLVITCRYNSGHVKNLVHSIGSDILTLVTEALSNEIWELKGNENKLLQTYEDAIAAGTQWGHDWTGDGTFDTDHIELNNGQSAYIRLSGPHQIKKPIIMTADLSLDAGGATGEAYVQISPDGVAWETVLDQDDFESGSTEYALQGSEYMTDCYVRLYCASGTSGKYLNVGSIKFEVERWIEDGAVPVVAAGATATASVDATSGSESVDIDGEFYPRRLFL